MNIQIFGKTKCFDTKKAERYFKERGIKYQYIDMKEKGMSKGELNTVCQAVGGLDKLLDDKCRDKDALALIRYIAEEDRTEKLLENWIKDRKLEESGEMEKLVNAAVLYPEMEHFLETLSLGAEGDIRRSGSRRFPADAVTLMTLHGSKGLEFPAVFIYGIRKGLLPLELGTASGDVQEERRLLYVGMTRAREELILTFSGETSMFLGEIPEKFSQREQAKKEKPVEEAVQLSLFDFMV